MTSSRSWRIPHVVLLLYLVYKFLVYKFYIYVDDIEKDQAAFE